METNKTGFIVKHREDVIDTLQLRAKERRVFYTLLVALLLTIAYENGGQLFSGFFAEQFVAPALGERQSAGVKPEMFVRLDRLLAQMVNEYPQFARNLKAQQQRLQAVMTQVTDPADKDAAKGKITELVGGLQEFVSHPAIARSNSLDAMGKELRQLARALQLVLPTELELKPVVFKSGHVNAESKTGQRNLFEFAGR